MVSDEEMCSEIPRSCYGSTSYWLFKSIALAGTKHSNLEPPENNNSAIIENITFMFEINYCHILPLPHCNTPTMGFYGRVAIKTFIVLIYNDINSKL